MAVSTKPEETPVDDPIVAAVILRHTSIAGRMFRPGLHQIPKSWAIMLQGLKIARPPKKRQDDVPEVVEKVDDPTFDSDGEKKAITKKGDDPSA